MGAIPTVFEGEVQLLRWSETSNQGATITFQLANPADLERFKNMTLAKGKQAGQRLMAAMVEIGDDEQPVEQPKISKDKPGEICIMACTFCADPLFQEWMKVANKEEARAKILSICHVSRRIYLDTDERAKRLFLENVRGPFMAFKAMQRRSA